MVMSVRPITVNVALVGFLSAMLYCVIKSVIERRYELAMVSLSLAVCVHGCLLSGNRTIVVARPDGSHRAIKDQDDDENDDDTMPSSVRTFSGTSHVHD